MSTGKSTFRGVDEDILVPILARLDTIRTLLGGDGPNAPAPATEAATPSRERALLEKIEREMSDLRNRFRRIDRHEKKVRQRFDRVEERIDDALHHLHQLQDPSRPDGHLVYSKLRRVEARVKRIKDIVNKHYNLPWEGEAGEQDSQKMASAAATTRTITKRMQEIRHGPQMRLLRLSVGGLEARLRGCVLCLAAFPEGAVIKKRLLIHWWFGERFVRSADEGKMRFDELADKGFLIPVRRGLCRTAHWCVVRPWMRDLLVDVSRSAAFLEPDSGNDFDVARRACLRHGKITSLKFDDELRAIYNIDNKYVELDEGWFAGKKELCALQLGQWRELDPREQIENPKEGHVEVSGTEHFADMAESCKNLRYISFRGISRIDSLPDAIGRLRELVVLDLRACHNLEKLGEGIVKLEKLEYLDVSDCHLLVGMPTGLDKLSQLEVLKGFVVASSNTWDDSCHLSDMNTAITDKLRKLSISISKMDERTERELQSLVIFKSVESLTITWGVVESKKKGDDKTLGEGGEESPVEESEEEASKVSSKGDDEAASVVDEESVEKEGSEESPVALKKEPDEEASKVSSMKGDDEATSVVDEESMGKEGGEESPVALKKEPDEEASKLSSKKRDDEAASVVDEESMEKEGGEESPVALKKEPDEEASKESSKKRDDEAASVVDEESMEKEGNEESPVALKKKPDEEASKVSSMKGDDEAASVIDEESMQKEGGEESPVALKEEPVEETSKVNSMKEDDEAASVSFRKDDVENALVSTDNKVEKGSPKKDGDEKSPVALKEEPDEGTSKVNSKKEDGEAASVSFQKEVVEDAPVALKKEPYKVNSNKEDDVAPVAFRNEGVEDAPMATDNKDKESMKKEGDEMSSVTLQEKPEEEVGGDGWIAKMEFELPPKLKKLDLRCFPLTEVPNWGGLKSTVRKLYVRGGKLTSLGDGETWEVEVLRLRFLKALRYDHDKFSGSFKKLKPECVEIHGCPDFNPPWKQDSTALRVVLLPHKLKQANVLKRSSAIQ